MDQPIYRWHSNLESLSNKQTGDLDYTEKYFGDYLTANSEPHMMCYDRFPDYHDHFRKEMTQALLYSYFYYQRALYNNKKAKVSQMLADIKNTFNKIKEKLNITTKDIITELTSDVERYSAARDAINSLSGKFIETQSLSQFYKSL